MERKFELHHLWTKDGRFVQHRIPGLLVTKAGTLLMYNEARESAGTDWSMMDIELTRSTDNGKTYEAPITLAVGTPAIPTVNNPVMMQDLNGRIHFLYCENYGVDGGRIYRRYSDDDGITWSDKIEITDATRPDYRNVFAFGPGHGICTADGLLLVPIWMVPKSCGAPTRSHGPSVISTFYSNDNGEHWQLGDILGDTESIPSPNETVATQLPNGEIYLNIRCCTNYRASARSKCGYSDWTSYIPEPSLVDPICFGSVCAHGDLLLFANCDCKNERKNVTVKASEDGGVTWKYSKVIDADRGGYVEIGSNESADEIYVLYEDDAGKDVYLAVMNLAWIKE